MQRGYKTWNNVYFCKHFLQNPKGYGCSVWLSVISVYFFMEVSEIWHFLHQMSQMIRPRYIPPVLTPGSESAREEGSWRIRLNTMLSKHSKVAAWAAHIDHHWQQWLLNNEDNAFMTHTTYCTSFCFVRIERKTPSGINDIHLWTQQQHLLFLNLWISGTANINWSQTGH